ncbi:MULTISPECIES: hypothetical protein [unclassified Ruegeria]|uniref:hypothetical protein n=1 Tax=unclassified Ruegeria TaxID=2625375 RepID=UPI0014881EC0|nr:MULTISPECIES: hypothetical protein [unclassified Ruegeria]NOD65382.1 hypothetical protein [Ruegeria sp. HKCCD6109]
MNLLKGALEQIAVALILSVGLPETLLAQEQAEETTSPEIIRETFDGEDQSLMLGGQVDFFGAKPPWSVYVADGYLVMENRQELRSLQFNDIQWVKFPGEDRVETTEDLVISAVVDGDVVGNGGVGILVGSGKSGVYTAFTVDDKGRFLLFKKDGRQLRLAHSGEHDAIVVGGPNELSFQVRGAQVLFYANGTRVVQIPFSKRTSNRSGSDGQAGIGLAAFGTGTFRFDEVEISKPN